MTQVATPETALASFDGVTVADVHGRPMRLSRARPAALGRVRRSRLPEPPDRRPRIERQVTMITGSHHQQVYLVRDRPAAAARPAAGRVPGPGAALDSAPRRRCCIRRRSSRFPRPVTGTAPVSRATRRTASRSSTRRSDRSRSPRRRCTTTAAEFGIACESCHGRLASTCARIATRCAATGCTSPAPPTPPSSSRRGWIRSARPRSAASATASGSSTTRPASARRIQAGCRSGPATSCRRRGFVAQPTANADSRDDEGAARRRLALHPRLVLARRHGPRVRAANTTACIESPCYRNATMPTGP